MCSAAAQHDAVIAEFCANAQSAVLSEIARLLAQAEIQPELAQHMLDYPLRHAKGLRPAICIAACRALGGSMEAVVRSACAFELLHNAFLIHDDVEDESLFRRGEPTLQRQVGMPQAVNVADGMFALALAPLLENTQTIGLGPALDVLERFRRLVLVTVAGQALELSWMRDNAWRFTDYRAAYEDMVLKKTAHYSFIGPVEVGTIVADASDATRDRLATYGRHLGIAFQITDDLLNLREDVPAYGKERHGDLWEGKRTLMLLYALHTADPDNVDRAIAILSKARPRDEPGSDIEALAARLFSQGHIDRVAMDALVGAPPSPMKTAADVASLYELIRERGGIEFATAVAREHVALAADALDGCRARLAPGEARNFLYALLAFVVERVS